MPALLTTMETSPHVRRVGDVVGAGDVEQDRDDVSVRDARDVAGGAVHLGTGVESAWAMAAPSPRLAPVTSAAAPSTFMR